MQKILHESFWIYLISILKALEMSRGSFIFIRGEDCAAQRGAKGNVVLAERIIKRLSADLFFFFFFFLCPTFPVEH